MKSTIPYLGLSSAEQRALIKPILDGHRLPSEHDWQEAIRTLWDGVRFREEWYAALQLARHRHYRDVARAPEQLDLYEHLIRGGRWWDVCDEIATHLVGGVLAADPRQATRVMRAWSTDDDLWIRRCSILAQLRRRDETDRALLSDCIEASLADRDFFARKAIGWALREFSKTDPGWVRGFVTAHAERLSGLSQREALRLLRPPAGSASTPPSAGPPERRPR